jgi:signal transduction histidine kinase
MKIPFKEHTISTVVVIPSAIIVVALAVLQYRWSSRVSEATAIRLADSLQMSMMNWQKDFFRYFSEIGQALRIDPIDEQSDDVSQYVGRFAEWRAAAKYPKVVSNFFVLESDASERPRALRLNTQTRRFEAQDWPGEFRPLRQDLARASKLIPRNPGAAANARLSLGINSIASARQETYGHLDLSDPAAGWWFEPEIPAILHPVILGTQFSRRGRSVDWIAIELSPQEIQRRILSDLSRTYFQGTDGLDYLVAVISGRKPVHVMYSSDPGFGASETLDADGTMDLFGRVRDKSLGSPVHVFHTPSDNKGPDASVRISWFPFLRDVPATGDWRLVVRHRRGGALGAFVTEMHRRDLAIGFGVLIVLVVNMAMLIVTSHRAQRLAQLQMDFVTAVSHELRTPLTVIISGADNIRNGVVGSTQQMLQYGSLIGNQARHLFGLVERILLFAATRQGRQRYTINPLEVHEVIDSALGSSAELIEASHFTVECDIDQDLPRVLGDAAALSQCLQNLITNALKYGGEQRWMGMRADAYRRGSAFGEVRISISDRGIGISEKDLPHIFEPFYRSPSVRVAQIHGTGLGLPLSKSIVEAMKGRLTVTSALGRGSTFTLHLPCVETASQSV